jgi:hypothetical protein
LEVYVFTYTLRVMNSSQLTSAILQEIASIKHMECGKLSIIRQGPKGPYYNLQRRKEGRNITEYVPSDQIPQVQEHILAHERFKTLVGDYEQQVTERTRAERKAGVKKKLQSQTFPSPKKPKSKI